MTNGDKVVMARSPKGPVGIVIHVEDSGTILVEWDTGSGIITRAQPADLMLHFQAEQRLSEQQECAEQICTLLQEAKLKVQSLPKDMFRIYSDDSVAVRNAVNHLLDELDTIGWNSSGLTC